MSRLNVYEKIFQLDNINNKLEKLRQSGADEKKLHVLEIMYEKHHKSDIKLLLLHQNDDFYYFFPDTKDVLIAKNAIDDYVDIVDYINLEQANKTFNDDASRFNDAIKITDNAILEIVSSKTINNWDDLKAYLLALYDFKLNNQRLDIQFLHLPNNNKIK